MGQKLATDCGCQDAGPWNWCAPQDPQAERQGQIETGQQGKRGRADQRSAYDSGVGGEWQDGRAQPQVVPPFAMENEADPYSYAPPPEDAYSPAPAPSPSYSDGQQGPPSGGGAGITFEMVLSELDTAESISYGQAFASFPGGSSGSIGMDCDELREFIVANSAISMVDIDTELLRVDAIDGGVTEERFLQVLREGSMQDADALTQFFNMSQNQESLSAEECRSGLLVLAQQRMSTNFSDARWDEIFTMVMMDAGVSVTMEQWTSYCKRVARICRLVRHAQL